MSGPGRVRLKRRRSELPPDTLIVEPSSKRVQPDGVPVNARYVRQKVSGSPPSSDVSHEERPAVGASSSRKKDQAQSGDQDTSKDDQLLGRKRTFHLKLPDTSDTGSKKRKSGDDGLATFIEKKRRREGVNNIQEAPDRTAYASDKELHAPERHKRPGRGSALPSTPEGFPKPAPSGDIHSKGSHKGLESLADDMHQFALDELRRDPNAPPVAKPKLSATRSRELHRQRVTAMNGHAKQEDMMELDEDGDYVYDTYVLASAAEKCGDVALPHLDSAAELGNVGYLVIEAANEALWEAYMDGNESSGESNSDEEDENAEDFYGADYPEDELASDDELDRGAYGYRANAGSDDEQWDADTGTWSDDEHDRMMNPFTRKTPLPTKYAKYLGDEDDSD